MSTNKEINKSKLMIVEGTDDEKFFYALLKKLDIKDVQIWNAKTVTDYKKEIRAINCLSSFYKVEKFIITRDADNISVKNAFESIQNILKELNLPYPKNNAEFNEKDGLSVGIFILPGNENGTMLEDLCLQTVQDDSKMQCVENFIKCIDSNSEQLSDEMSKHEKRKKCSPKNIAKAKIQTYLAGRYEIVNSLGLGAQKGYWNFEHECLGKLKSFLLKLN